MVRFVVWLLDEIEYKMWLRECSRWDYLRGFSLVDQEQKERERWMSVIRRRLVPS